MPPGPDYTPRVPDYTPRVPDYTPRAPDYTPRPISAIPWAYRAHMPTEWAYRLPIPTALIDRMGGIIKSLEYSLMLGAVNAYIETWTFHTPYAQSTVVLLCTWHDMSAGKHSPML